MLLCPPVSAASAAFCNFLNIFPHGTIHVSPYHRPYLYYLYRPNTIR
jgi:hypothetical protein